jgi:hypothetical protein
VVTAILGYKSFSKYLDAYVYYQRAGSHIIPVKKSNSLSKEYTQKIIPLFGISYDEFVDLYKSRS